MVGTELELPQALRVCKVSKGMAQLENFGMRD